MSNIDRVRFYAVVGLLTLAAVVGCTSRYRLDLFMTVHGERKKVKVETTHYAPNTILNSPEAQEPILPGTRSTAVITTSMRGRESETEGSQVLGFDEYLRVRIYLEFPAPLVPDTLSLLGRSYVHMLGRYELPSENKIFRPESGSLVIDSVIKKHLYASIDGTFLNPDSLALTCRGQFKIKIQD